MEPGDLKVLIVDDDPLNRMLIEKIIYKSGFQYSTASDGEEALEKAFSEHFDIILLDIMMPGKDGFQVCEEIRANPATQNIPIIFITAKNDEESVQKGYGCGAQDYITKPFDQHKLIKSMRKHLGTALTILS